MAVAHSGKSGWQRLRTDQGEPGFWMGRQFAWEYELDLAAGEVQVFKFILAGDVLLLESGVTVDDGTLYYRVYRADQITETGAFATDLTGNTTPLNSLSFAPAYSLTTTAFTDEPSVSGGVTIDDDKPYPKIRLRTAGATGQAVTTGQRGGSRAGVPRHGSLRGCHAASRGGWGDKGDHFPEIRGKGLGVLSHADAYAETS